MKKDFILDPLWITQGTYLDSEYFNYVLLDASVKYKEEIAADNIDRFCEVMFHILNLNNLAVTGNLFTAKYKEIWKEARIKQIQEELKKVYDLPDETTKIFKNANYVFLNIAIEYMKIHLDVLDKIKLFYMNKNIHHEKEIFIVTNKLGTNIYRIWKLSDDPKKNFGYSFTKVKTITIPDLVSDSFVKAVDSIVDPKLAGLTSSKNVCFAIIQEKEDESMVAKTVKDTLLLNKGIAKNHRFEPLLIGEVCRYIWTEKMLPFTLSQWRSEDVKEL